MAAAVADFDDLSYRRRVTFFSGAAAAKLACSKAVAAKRLLRATVDAKWEMKCCELNEAAYRAELEQLLIALGKTDKVPSLSALKIDAVSSYVKLYRAECAKLKMLHAPNPAKVTHAPDGFASDAAWGDANPIEDEDGGDDASPTAAAGTAAGPKSAGGRAIAARAAASKTDKAQREAERKAKEAERAAKAEAKATAKAEREEQRLHRKVGIQQKMDQMRADLPQRVAAQRAALAAAYAPVPGAQPPAADEFIAARTADGRPYWYHKISKLTTWTDPNAPPPPPPAAAASPTAAGSPTAAAGSGSGDGLSLAGAKQLLYSDIQFGARLGAGSFGTGYRGVWKGADVVIKVMNQPPAPASGSAATAAEQAKYAELVDEWKREVLLLSRLSHPHIVQFFGYVLQPSLCMVLRFAKNGTAEHVLMSENKFPNVLTDVHDRRMVVQMAVDTASALSYIHSENPPVIHRDLACRNLLVDDNYRVWLNDFGMSRSLRADSDADGKTQSNIGPVKWMAPEAMQQVYSSKSDAWMFGVTLFEMFAREAPYKGLSGLQATIQVATKGNGLKIDDRWPQPIREVMQACLQTRAADRPELSSVHQKLNAYLQTLIAEDEKRTAPAPVGGPAGSTSDAKSGPYAAPAAASASSSAPHVYANPVASASVPPPAPVSYNVYSDMSGGSSATAAGENTGLLPSSALLSGSSDAPFAVAVKSTNDLKDVTSSDDAAATTAPPTACDRFRLWNYVLGSIITVFGMCVYFLPFGDWTTIGAIAFIVGTAMFVIADTVELITFNTPATATALAAAGDVSDSELRVLRCHVLISLAANVSFVVSCVGFLPVLMDRYPLWSGMGMVSMWVGIGFLLWLIGWKLARYFEHKKRDANAHSHATAPADDQHHMKVAVIAPASAPASAGMTASINSPLLVRVTATGSTTSTSALPPSTDSIV